MRSKLLLPCEHKAYQSKFQTRTAKLHIHHANYAILRQGFHNKMTGVRITNGRFTDLQGDAGDAANLLI